MSRSPKPRWMDSQDAFRLSDLAAEESRSQGNSHIGTEHLLLALIADGGTAAKILSSLAPHAVIRARLLGLINPSPSPGFERHPGPWKRSTVMRDRSGVAAKDAWGNTHIFLADANGRPVRSASGALIGFEHDEDGRIVFDDVRGTPRYAELRNLPPVFDSVGNPLQDLQQVDGESDPMTARPPSRFGKTDAGAAESDGWLEWTTALSVVFALAEKEAQFLGHPYVGSEHLLLALLDTDDNAALWTLCSLEDENRLRMRIYRCCSPQSPAGLEHYQLPWCLGMMTAADGTPIVVEGRVRQYLMAADRRPIWTSGGSLLDYDLDTSGALVRDDVGRPTLVEVAQEPDSYDAFGLPFEGPGVPPE